MHLARLGQSAARLSAARSVLQQQLQRSRQLHAPSKHIERIGVITDVEGNMPFFKASTALSSVITYNPVSNRIDFRDATSNRDAFVYGGDCFDKGEGDMRISRALVDFKERHPDRVFLLLGNRDLNKMKLYAELDDADVYGRKVEDIPAPFWIPAKHATHLKDFLAKGNLPNNTLSRAHYYFNCTMGMGLTFEARRRELAQIAGQPITAITDDDVLQTFIDGVRRSDGFYRRYIESAQVGVCIHDTLFVHGAVTPDNMGFVPDQTLHYGSGRQVTGREMAQTHSVQEWIDALNQFAHTAIEDWKQNPLHNKERTRLGGAPLLAYGHRLSCNSRTVVVRDWTDHTGNLAPIPTAVEDYLRKSNIRRVVTGHKPLGDSPAIIRSNHLEVICADTSFSDPAAPDNRGCAVNEVLIEGVNSLVTRSRVRGVLSSGKEYNFVLPSTKPVPDASSSWGKSGDQWVGKQVPHRSDWWVRARLSENLQNGDPNYHVAFVKGFDVMYNTWSGATTVEVGSVNGRAEAANHDHSNCDHKH